jgi:Tfp pilus assembly protein PilN
MSRTDALNLARRPFVNTRPVVRVAVLLWAVAALLAAANLFLFWGYFSGSGEQRGRIVRIDREIERSRERIGELENETAGLDLAQQNERVLFLNEKIAQRTFSWSLLFDRVAEVLPAEVRLRRLTPMSASEEAGGRRRRRPGAESGGAERMTLTVGGEAMSDEALLQLVDNLFGHPSFRDYPDLTNESKDGGTGLITFDLRVSYLPSEQAVPGQPPAPGPPTIEEVEPPAEAPAGEEPATPATGAEPEPSVEPRRPPAPPASRIAGPSGRSAPSGPGGRR